MTASTDDRATARQWLHDHATLNPADLKQALADIYGDGALIGTATAAQATGAVVGSILDLPDQPADWQAFWDTWTPGDSDAASLLNDGGLADLLDSADVTVRGVSGTLLDRLGNALADGAASGESVDAIASSLSDIVADPGRAYQIADTELARAVSSASMQTYANNGVGEWDLLTSPGACADCEDVAADNPYPVDDTENTPPIHPSCRCSASPVIGPSDDGSTAAADG